MIGGNLHDREREALRELLRLVDERVAAEQACQEAFDNAKTIAKRDVAKARKIVAAERERERQAITMAQDEARRTIQDKFVSEQAAADRLHQFTSQEAGHRRQSDDEKTQTQYSDAIWTADSLYEAAEKQANEQFDVLKRKATAGQEAIEATWARAQPFFARVGMNEFESYPSHEEQMAAAPTERLQAALDQAYRSLEQLMSDRSLDRVGVVGFLRWLGLFGLFAAIPPIFMTPRFWWIVGGLSFVLAAGVIAHAVVRSMVKRRCRVIAAELLTSLTRAKQAREAVLHQAKTEHRATLQDATRQRQGQKFKAQEKFPPILARIEERGRAEIATSIDKHEHDTERLQSRQYDSLQKVESHSTPLLQQCEARCDAQLAEAEKLFEERRFTATTEHAKCWDALSTNWRLGQDKILDIVNHLRAAELEFFLPWDAPFWQEFPPVEKVPSGMRFATITVDLHDLPGGVPTHADLTPVIPIKMDLPAFLPFPERGNLVVKSRDAGREQAIQVLKRVILRYLTALPAGKVRFTVIDPVGLGDNFAAFMHLADYDENLIGSRIWTETGHIEKRLSELTAHMENVIQKYLRNQFASIVEYNVKAGEVAEPFRVLVVANFPANFNLEAARRLVSIMQSGATCGVYTVVSIDTRLPPPQGFNMADLETGATVIVWKDEQFIWKDPDFSRFPLTMRPPPPTDEIIRLTKIVGERGRNSNRVQVPFEAVLPKPEMVWKSDSRKGISVPIGRSGATKFQLFQLGIGTAQHALIAGKTGSGKSTLLHAIITNLAMHYSPDEIELYLIDFKKGVEFKAYAENRLPHARVVAIESEREFGLSVLQRLDSALKERGDLFRAAGANDVATFRAAMPGTPLPRIMLIVDEFQEFFIEDDRVSQETALLLDRLVRQGRAFGLHIILGSQTLGGAYTLARSTIDQMAVRIALQCSDADAQLILNKDNTAARLLTRPGEAIYNDANGLSEGNDLFQIVWLNDVQREELLLKLADRGKKFPPPLVFEGNTAGDLKNNRALATLLAKPAWATNVRSASAWLGEAIAIKEPTAALFRPQGGSHLLIIGQNDEAALGLLSAALVSLAAQHDPRTSFLILDSTPDDDQFAGKLGQVAKVLPHTVDFTERTTVGEQLGKWATLVAERQKGDNPDRSPRFVLVYGLQRYRELRKEDDFGFGKRGAERTVSPAEHFGNILRDGPAVGVHALIWCDGLNNLNRTIDRQLLREFGMRVLFQMNANDSSALIDNPLASRLGRNRALYLTEEAPQPEKFRPYGFPDAEWLKQVQETLAQRQREPAHAG